jgi:pimeloyl-ACP methyl ester carboxylesterase
VGVVRLEAGHGGSAKPRGDYSLGAYASGMRDLLAALGHERATVVGHSMGGGIAMVLSSSVGIPAAR